MLFILGRGGAGRGEAVGVFVWNERWLIVVL